MVTYFLEVINAILLPTHQVPGRPTFRTLWKLSQELQEFLGKMEDPYHPDEGCSSYIMMQATYELYSTIIWKNPADLGKYFIVPTTAITNTNHKPEEIKLQAGKNLLNTYCNIHVFL